MKIWKFLRAFPNELSINKRKFHSILMRKLYYNNLFLSKKIGDALEMMVHHRSENLCEWNSVELKSALIALLPNSTIVSRILLREAYENDFWWKTHKHSLEIFSIFAMFKHSEAKENKFAHFSCVCIALKVVFPPQEKFNMENKFASTQTEKAENSNECRECANFEIPSTNKQ